MEKKEEIKNAVIERVKNDIKNAVNANDGTLYELCETERSKYDKYCMTKTQMEWFDNEVIKQGVKDKVWSLSDFDAELVEEMYETCGGHGYADDDEVLYQLVSEHGYYIDKVEVVNVTAEIIDEGWIDEDEEGEPDRYYVQGTIEVKVNGWEENFELNYGDWDDNLWVICRK